MDKRETKLNNYIDRLRQKIDIDTIIIFGSYSKDQCSPSSDIDILIVSDDFKRMSELEAYILLSEPLWDIEINVDPVSATIDDLKECTRASFLSNILSTGKVIFRKSA